MTDLHIPDEAIDAVEAVIQVYDNEGVARRIATPVVVAELRRLVEDIGPHWGAAAMVIRDRARARADELEADR